MSKAEYWQRGESIDYKNVGSSVIEANSVIIIGKRVGVAGMTIRPGETGSIHVKGVFSFDKDAVEIAAGTEVYFDGEKITTAAQTGSGNTATDNIPAGFAAEAAAESGKTVLVSINA